jgi:hypothetical protein
MNAAFTGFARGDGIPVVDHRKDRKPAKYFNRETAAIYSAASAWLCQALFAPLESAILPGAGKSHADGSVEAGFAVASKEMRSAS